MHSHFDALFDQNDGIGLSQYIQRGDVTPAELLEAAIIRLERVDAKLNAVSERLYDSARQACRNLPQGRFSGVPTFIKDLFSPVQGAAMSNGSIALGGFRADFEAEMVSRLRRAGCVVMGSSTSPEFGTSYSTESVRFGATRNPWNLAHSAGGSSGGAAALVAARVVPFAHGNDGGGSLRVPASCCGVFGFKPTRGRQPSGPMVGEGWGGMGIPHAITLSVRDSAALLDATAGADLGAPYAAPAQATPFLDAVGRDPARLRIVLVDELFPARCTPDAWAAVQHTAQLCEGMGHTVQPARLPVDLGEFLDHVFNIIGASTQNYLNLLGQMRDRPVALDEVEARTRIILREKGQVSGAQYAASIDWIHAFGRRMAAFMQDFDVILSPTLTQAPPKIGVLDIQDDSMGLAEMLDLFHRYSPFTALFNASGQPAMSVPLYWTESGLPLGSHFAGRFADESLLFSLAGQLERAQPWARRLPPVRAGSAA